MPILVKDYTWEETEKHIFINVPLKGAKSNKIDILTTEEYIKVHYPPYLFEVFLFSSVHDEDSRAEIGNGVVVFKIEKQEQVLWGQLQHPEAEDKQTARELREAAVLRVQQRHEEQEKQKKEKKRERDQYALKEQMKLEDDERTRIEEEKESERRKATEDLERWKEEQKLQAQKEKAVITDTIPVEKMHISNGHVEKAAKETEMVPAKKCYKTATQMFKDEAEGKPMREPGKIEVTFTPRVFPTAARESIAHEEEEWLRKQAEAKRVVEIENSDLTEEEKNPMWLKDKANSFFKAGDYQSAVNVYSHAIRLNPKLFSLFSNRAACHLKLRNFFKAIEDTSKALELLTPPVPQNAKSRCIAHVRRGTALCELEMYTEGLMDYDAALKLDKNNQQLIEDAQKMRELVQGPKPS